MVGKYKKKKKKEEGTTGLGKLAGMATGLIGAYNATKSGSAPRGLKTAGTLGVASVGGKIGDEAEKWITKKIKKYKKKKK